MKTLQTLYKKTSTGKDQEWTIAVDKNVIITRFGQVGGKIQEARDTISAGKNQGRANATTKEEQALLEAEAIWTKKLKKGYVKTLKDARAGKVDKLITGGIWPMLAEKFRDYGDDLVYPCYTQPKLDGHRCIAIVDGGVCTLWSRGRQPIKSMPHIVSELQSLFPSGKYIIDGELYNHAYKDKFEQLTEFITPDEPVPGHEVVEYHIYDACSEDPFEKRTRWLQIINGPSLKLVETLKAADEDELLVWFEHFLEQGYEGAVARNANSKYKSVSATARSRDLLKIKKFDDDEFKVFDVVEGRGKLNGHAIFVCKTAAGVEFKAKQKGPIPELKKIFDNADKYIGKMLTVRYQGYTKKNNVPRFPVALRLRKDA
jgi:ATP-dependent DNA ligase